MKKTLVILLAMLMLLISAGSSMANPGNGNGPAKAKAQMQKNGLEQTRESNKNQLLEKKELTIRQTICVKKELKESIKTQIKEHKGENSRGRFKDAEKHWAAKSIDLLSAAGLFSGYPDGSFQPDKCITQAESIALVMRLVADEDEVQGEETAVADETIDAEVDEENLTEVPEWSRTSTQKAARKGYIKLNRFHSSVQATRAQTAVWIAKAIGLSPVDTSDMPFKDGLFISQEDLGYILALYKEGIIQGTPNGNFNPNNAITRAEMATIMEKILVEQAIESVTMQDNASVNPGESITLTATVTFADGTTDNNVIWSSSDSDLATVVDGLVTTAADQTGTVTITATAVKDGVSMSASCELTIVTESGTDSENDSTTEPATETDPETDPVTELDTDI